MKKQLLLITGLAGLAAMAFGGGIVTNTNQSAAWVRSLNRDASTSADAVYFNPAGLIKLNDGFHFSLNTQTIFQSKDVTSNYNYLSPSPKTFLGDVTAPVFPGFYATWKKNKLAVSFGFNPIGGGGGATFKTGLPSFELPISDLVPSYAAQGATDYRLDAYLKGTSVFFGYQGGISYKINDVISVFGGLRYVTGKNTYEGHLKDIDVMMGTNWVPAPDLLNGTAAYATAGANNVQTAIDNGVIDATDPVSASLAASMTQLGIPNASDLTNEEAIVALDQASAGYATKANLLSGQEVDVEQKGSGFTPIIGVNLSFDKLNIGLKYEFITKIEVENETTSDFILGYSGTTPITMFPDGKKTSNDLPAMFSIGASYSILPAFRVSAGFHYYFDKSANYGKTIDGQPVDNDAVIDDNYFELSAGLEYDITEKLLVSGGYLHANTGVSEEYQSDLSFSLTSNTFGIGLGYKFTEKLMLNLGGAYTAYQKDTKDYTHTLGGNSIPVTDTYYKDNLFFGLGVDFSF
jgi:long-chain fatty acid transport protein